MLLRILKEPLLVPVREGRQDLVELRWLLVMPDHLRLHHMVYNTLNRFNYSVRQVQILNKVRPFVLFKVTEILEITSRFVIMVRIIVMHMPMYILIFTLRLIFIVRAIVGTIVVTIFRLLGNMNRHVDMHFLMHLLALFIFVLMLIILFGLLVLVLLSFFVLRLFIFFRVCRNAIFMAV